MASFTAPIKVDPVLKGNFLALRDALGVLPTEQAVGILEAARAQATSPAPVPSTRPVPTSPAPVPSTASTTPVPAPVPSPTPERLLLVGINRPVPSGLVGILNRLLDRADRDPSQVRQALIRATRFL